MHRAARTKRACVRKLGPCQLSRLFCTLSGGVYVASVALGLPRREAASSRAAAVVVQEAAPEVQLVEELTRLRDSPVKTKETEARKRAIKDELRRGLIE